MMETMFVRFSENGDIQTFGSIPEIGIEVEIPTDWHLYSHLKYVANADRTGIVVRAGWVDPVISDEPEVPTEPETPADPE
jgi:hypothetical protein